MKEIRVLRKQLLKVSPTQKKAFKVNLKKIKSTLAKVILKVKQVTL